MNKLRTLLLGAALLPVVAVAAWAGPFFPPVPSGTTKLSVSGALVGNTADTNEDVLFTFTLPAGQLANVGDRIHLVGMGTFAGSTDGKNVRIRIGGANCLAGTQIALAATGSSTTITGWSLDGWITKTGASTQSYGTFANLSNTSANPQTVTVGTLALTDTGTIPICITGRNATTATAGTVAVQYAGVDYLF